MTTRFLAGCVVLALALAIFWLLFVTRQQPAIVDSEAFVQRIAVMEARPVAVRRQWEGFGTARARHAANVPAQVRGVVVEVPQHIVAGATVVSGEVLVQLDDSDFREEVERSTYRLDDIDAQLAQIDIELRRLTQRVELVQDRIALAQADLERITDALERGSATQREVDQIRQILIEHQQSEVALWEQIERLEPRRTQLRAARSQEEANLRIARRNLERCTIRSPIDGVIQRVHVDLGESITADQPVARVVNLNRIEVPLRFPASARLHVAVGDPVALHDAGASGASWPAEVTRIAPEDDERTRTMIVYVEIEQEPGNRNALSPGKFVQGMVYSSAMDEQWIVPRRAVQGDRIRLIENGNVRSMPIERSFAVRGEFPEFGIPDEEWIALRQPLYNGGLIVLDGGRQLTEGAPVEAVVAGRQNGEEFADTSQSLERAGSRNRSPGNASEERSP